jgi:cytochrome P450
VSAIAPTAPPRAPGPKPKFPGRSLLAVRRDPLAFFSSLAREYGDIVQFKLGPEQLFLVSHPDVIRDVLVTHQRNFHKGRGLERAKSFLGEGLLTSEDDFHLRQRRLAQPAFHRQRIAGYAEVMSAYAERHQRRWRDRMALDVHQEMMTLTLAIVGKTLFDADLEGEASDIGGALGTIFETFNATFFNPIGALLEKLPLPMTLRFRAARARLDATVYRMIAERRRSGLDRGDLLSMLLLAQDTEGDGGRMSDLQLRDEAMTVFLAGHETTANALTWTWYLLSGSPEVEARLHAEVDSLGSAALGMDDVARLPYTRMVLAESMRLYPPAWALGRRAKAACEMGGYPVPARAIVIASPYVVHRDARWFPHPERFDPERWRAERAAERPKFSYFPFGGGTRVCIGEQFAWTEGILLLATIARLWRFRLVAGHPVALQPIITLRPKHGMRMIAELR